MSAIIKKYAPQFLLIALVVPICFQYTFSHPLLNLYVSKIQNYHVIITAIIQVVAVSSLVLWHISRIRKRGEDWMFSILYVVLYFFTISLLWFEGSSGLNYVKLWAVHDYIGFARVAMLALSGLWVMYRTFRPKNIDLIIIIACSIVTMLGGATVGGFLWSGFEPVSTWLTNVMSSAGNSAILLGAGIGEVFIALRVILGTESTFMRLLQREVGAGAAGE